jgi:hypothetical protein
VEWERTGWMRAQEPRAWLQWCCRFYLSQRSLHDEQQIARWAGVCGAKGISRKHSKQMVRAGGKKWANPAVAPGLRQRSGNATLFNPNRLFDALRNIILGVCFHGGGLHADDRCQSTMTQHFRRPSMAETLGEMLKCLGTTTLCA